jgi:hypothetical protein
VRIIVWELAAGDEKEAASLARAVANRGSQVSILIRLELFAASSRRLLRLADDLPNVHLSLGRQEDLALAIARLDESPRDRSASPVILKRLLPVVPADLTEIVAIAVIAGQRHPSVEELATLCRLPVRTLQSHITEAHSMPAKDLLGSMISLHALWRIDVLQWPSKRAAQQAEFPTREAWSRYIENHTGARPLRLRRNGGFADLLDRCVVALQEGRHARG